MLPWKSIIVVNSNSQRAIYLQVVDQFIKEIMAGHIKPGLKLPGTRSLAEMLEVNRKTVIQAFDELIAQGWLESKSSSGTYVVDKLPIQKKYPLKTERLLSEEPNFKIKAYPYIESYDQSTQKRLIVNGGSPDPRLGPMDWIYRESKSIIRMRNGHKLLHYNDEKGNPHLRYVLAKYLSETRGMQVTPENILITRGSQMGIFLTMAGLLEAGQHVVVGETSYDAADWAIQYHKGSMLRAPVDQEGLDVDRLEELCATQNIRLVYVTPHHHFPTTVTLSNTRRMKLLSLAEKHDFYILEDDYDFDFHYKSAPLLPLASISPNSRVIYIGAFSKIFAPNIRVGYLVAPENVVNTLSKIRKIIDRQGDNVMEGVLAEAIVSGELNRHLKKSLKVYRQRRDYLVELLKRRLSKHVSFKNPEGGMAIWLKFTSQPLLKLKPQFEKKGLYLDIDKKFAKEHNAVRFGFASLNEKELEEAVDIIEEEIIARI